MPCQGSGFSFDAEGPGPGFSSNPHTAGENAGLEALQARVQELETAASSPAGSGAGEADPAIQEALSALEERVSALPENAVSADQVEALQQELAALREAANAAQQAASGNSERHRQGAHTKIQSVTENASQ